MRWDFLKSDVRRSTWQPRYEQWREDPSTTWTTALPIIMINFVLLWTEVITWKEAAAVVVPCVIGLALHRRSSKTYKESRKSGGEITVLRKELAEIKKLLAKEE